MPTLAANPTSPPAAGRANCARVRRWRAARTRVDYAPSPEALAAIKLWAGRGLDNCTVGVIDRLILAGAEAISGNAKR